MKRSKSFLITVFSLLLGAGVAMADIPFVAIGGAGNGADTTGYGAVGYDFQISKTEIPISEFQKSGLGGGDYWNVGGQTVGTNAPASRVSWNQAARYCNWLTSGDTSVGAYTIGTGDKVTAVTTHDGLAMDALVATHGVVYVLPTEDEWYKAAYYNGGYSLFSDGTGTAPPNAVYGSLTNPEVVDHLSLEQNGTLNMGGNVWEWMETPGGGEPFNGSDDNQAMVIRGGAYHHPDDEYLQSVNRLTDPGLLRTVQSEDIGFRIVAIPEPGTISLMSLSTVGLFLTRTMRRRKRVGQTLMPVRREPLCDVFVSEQEWRSAYHEIEEDGYFAELGRQLRALIVSRINIVAEEYQSLDRAFWDRMVVRHERKVAKRKARIEAFKKKALSGFDEFLALIMK